MVTIVTGPTHCGKSTYISENTLANESHIDVFDYQDGRRTIEELQRAQYDFYYNVEELCRNTSGNVWIEGSFSNPYRIGQLINTVRAAGREDKIRVIYILRSKDWYMKHLDFIESGYSMAQMRATKLYEGSDAAVYKLNNSNELEKVK